MYRHILLPTDGSALSRKAVQSAVHFARHIGARLTGIHIMPVLHQVRLEAWLHHDPQYARRKKEFFEKRANDYLAFIANSALADEVPCVCKTVVAEEAHLGILSEVWQGHCDLIFMASHGWSEIAKEVLGSETQKVLRQSPVPVLVFRNPPENT